MKPLAIDLFCGLGGWTDGLLAEGWDVFGFDLERHDYGTGGYPAQLVLMDVQAIHGAMFKDADLIVASPPCQEFSYRAMPWKRAKALPPPLLGTNLFWQCWRIQQEACEAAGRYIPMVVENVKGAQKWVGRAKGHFGSFYLWGDVENVGGRLVRSGPVEFGMESVIAHQSRMKSRISCAPRMFKDRFASTADEAHALHYRMPVEAIKNNGGSWFAIGSPGQTNLGQNPDGRRIDLIKFAAKRYPELLYADRDSEGIKQHGSGPEWWRTGNGAMSSKSSARKAASAQIAKIPEPLSRHIARVFKP